MKVSGFTSYTKGSSVSVSVDGADTEVRTHPRPPAPRARVSDLRFSRQFASTAIGTPGDNPTDPNDLDATQQARSVTLLYGSPLSQFAVSFKVNGNSGASGGRNFNFAGSS